jgi:hypothetical protein
MASKQEIEPMAALAGIAAAMMDAARHTRSGLGTAGRRAAQASGDLGRRAWSNARDSRQRAAVAYRVYRGEELTPRVRPGRYVAIGAIGGAATAYAVVALGRMIRRGPDAGPGSRQLRQAVDWARANTARVVRRTSSEPAGPAALAEPAGPAKLAEPAGPVKPAEAASGPPTAEAA